MTTIEDIRALGYDVTHDPESDTASIMGFGVATMVDPKSTDTLTSFTDPDTHVERVNQFNDAHGIPVTAKAKKIHPGG